MADVKKTPLPQEKRSVQELIFRKPRLLLILIIIASCAVYLNALYNGFVYDDASQVLANNWIRDIKHIPQIFSSNVWQFEGTPSNYYRPLMHVVYLFNYLLFGLRPWGFHFVNVLFHAGVSVLVFLIAARLFETSRHRAAPPSWAPPVLTALLFAVHPVHTEAVAWVAGLPELGFTFFTLLSFHLYLLARETKAAAVMYGSSLLSYACALLFKETALVLPVILVAYDIVFREQGQPVPAMKYVPYAVVTGIYIMVRVYVLGGFAPVQRYGGLSTCQHAINALPLFTDYLGKLVLPANLNAYHVFHPLASILEIKAMLALAISSVLAVFAWIMAKNDKTVFFSLALFLLPLAPVLYISGVGENTFAERYLYLPSFGFSLLFVSGIVRLTKQRWSPVLLIGLLAVLGLSALGTVQRNAIWKNDVRLWTDTVKKSPDSVVPQAALGYALLNEGSTDKAITYLQAVLSNKPDFLEAHYNIGIAYGKKGLDDEAIRHFQAALALKPDYMQAHKDLALAYHRTGLLDGAIEQYEMVVALTPGSAAAHNDLAIAYGERGLIDRAIEQFQAALRLNPDNLDVHYNLGVAYGDKGMHDRAIEQLQAALRLSPDDAGIRYELSRVLAVRELTREDALRKAKKRDQ